MLTHSYLHSSIYYSLHLGFLISIFSKRVIRDILQLLLYIMTWTFGLLCILNKTIFSLQYMFSMCITLSVRLKNLIRYTQEVKILLVKVKLTVGLLFSFRKFALFKIILVDEDNFDIWMQEKWSLREFVSSL